MPCKYCKNVSHTIAECTDPSSDNILGAVVGLVTNWPFDFRFQIKQLKNLKKAELAIACKSLGETFSEPKYVLICKIIDYFFTVRTFSTPAMQNLSPEDIHRIHNSYDELLEWNASSYNREIRMNCGTLLERFYHRFFGLVRNGRSLEDYINQLHHPESKDHLAKLKIKIRVDQSLQVQECIICCEENPNAKLGCGHEYCVDCVSNTAKAREKSVISCAMCRAEISSINVESTKIKKELKGKIKIY